MKIKSKFAIGDKAFVLKDNEVVEVEIKAVFFDGRRVRYSVKKGPLVFRSYPEEHIFATEEELFEYIFGYE